MTKPKVLTFGKLEWADAGFLADFESKFDVHAIEPPSNRDGAIRAVAEAAKTAGPFDAAILLMGNSAYSPFDAPVFGPLAMNCRIVACVNAGFSEFDLDWFTANKMYVTNTLHAVAEPTADIAIFLILAVLRDTTREEMNVRKGGWKNASAPPRDPNGLTLGIIGMGRIGKVRIAETQRAKYKKHNSEKHVARKAKAFGLKIQYFNRSPVPAVEETALDATYCSKLDDLLATSDVISVNCPLSDATRDLIGVEEIAKMKDGVFLVNTGRGPIVNEKALIEGLRSGKITRAGLDVFDNEPNINPWFRSAENCVVLPHMGSWTDAAWKNAYHECMDNILAFFARGKPISPVNTLE
ncbi:hypothetical protein N7468_007128 [Penicillium chermesinum]|uniref:Uncharacterized protein n=1 Tax=Penicillium chermesinum TaxID=63820 RepID=A0A9W9TKD2_9EURO|nr:uncharacterized protein N7468_007128 [Penicillium chermesinum]KAJ5225903.1 hypothetical protein N7468_007128 [Penicillium chermesinum]